MNSWYGIIMGQLGELTYSWWTQNTVNERRAKNILVAWFVITSINIYWVHDLIKKTENYDTASKIKLLRMAPLSGLATGGSASICFP